jgi:DNA-binding transcriptional LysR family regulator
MDKFEEMRTFVAVVDAGSFVQAADALDISKAAVSRHVADLEQRLGVRPESGNDGPSIPAAVGDV